MRVLKTRLAAVAVAVTMASGCATSINNAQKQELRHWEGIGVKVEEKNEAAGAALGLLPGFGSFYAEEYAVGVVNLLLWPGSVLWDPISGYQGTQAINYYSTRSKVETLKSRQMAALDDKLELDQISRADYVKERRAIESKYSPY